MKNDSIIIRDNLKEEYNDIDKILEELDMQFNSELISNILENDQMLVELRKVNNLNFNNYRANVEELIELIELNFDFYSKDIDARFRVRIT